MHRHASRPAQRLVPLAFASVYLFWGSSFVAIRYSTQMLHPAFVAGLRYCIAGIVLLAFLLIRGQSLRITRRDLLYVSGLGLLMFTCNTVLLSYGGKVLPAGLTSLIISTIPLFIALLEALLPSGVRTSWWGRTGILAGFFGLFLLLQSGLRASASVPEATLAAAALVAAAFAWALGSVLLRRIHFTAPQLVTTCWQMLIGGIVDLLIGVAFGGLQSSHWTTGATLSLLYLAICGTLIGYTSYTFLLRNVTVSSAATYAYINPLVAVLLGWVLLKESPAQSQWLGIVVVLTSVAMVVTAKPRRVLEVKPSTQHEQPGSLAECAPPEIERA